MDEEASDGRKLKVGEVVCQVLQTSLEGGVRSRFVGTEKKDQLPRNESL